MILMMSGTVRGETAAAASLMMVVFMFERGNEDFSKIGKIFQSRETSKTDAKNVRKRPSFAREGEERIVVLRLWWSLRRFFCR